MLKDRYSFPRTERNSHVPCNPVTMEISPSYELQRNKLQFNSEQRPIGCMKLANSARPLPLPSLPSPAKMVIPVEEL